MHHQMKVGEQIYGLQLKTDTIYLTADQTIALDRFLSVTPDVEDAERDAARAALRQALGFDRMAQRI